MKDIKITLCADKPIISNYCTKTKAVIDKATLIDLILDSQHLNSPTKELLISKKLLSTCEDELDSQSSLAVEHWKNRNWELSLFYYIWSRTGDLYDTGIDYKKKQSDTIISYAKESSLPKENKLISIKSFKLDKKAPLVQETVGSIMKKREAVRATPIRTISIEILSSILWYGLKSIRDYITINDVEKNPTDALQSFGSAFDIYICIYNSENLEPGIYYYDILNNNLELIKQFEIEWLRKKMYEAQVEQKAALTAGVSIMLTCHFARYQWRYRQESALRQLYINCGQIIHPLMLLATSYDLKTHISPAIMDSCILEIIGIPKEEYQVMYILSIG